MDTASLSRDMGRYSCPLHHAGQIISLHGGIIYIQIRYRYEMIVTT